MSEEEIKESIERLECFEPDDLVECAMYRACLAKIQGLFDLYQKEKEKNKELELRNEALGDIILYNQKNSIIKDKIKEKIEELEAMSISQDIYYDDVKRLFQELLEEE